MNISANPGSTRVNHTGGWRTYKPDTDLVKCIGCSLCAKVCPENCITMKMIKGQNKPVTDYDFCKGCGLCAAECPVKAITMNLEEK